MRNKTIRTFNSQNIERGQKMDSTNGVIKINDTMVNISSPMNFYEYAFDARERRWRAKEIILEVEKLPYSFASTYSLRDEKRRLEQLEKRNYNMHMQFAGTDMAAISKDWARVGDYLNEGIRRYNEEVGSECFN